MTPYRRHGRKKGPFYVAPSLPGLGRIGPYSTGTKVRAQAEKMEVWLQETWLREPELVRGLLEGLYTLPEIYVAHKEGRAAELKADATDVPLATAVERYRTLATDRRVLDGLDQIVALSPKGARLSYLTGPGATKRISDLCLDAVSGKDREGKGRAPNSVRRSLYRAIAELLEYEVPDRKEQVLAKVKKPYAKDERDVRLSPEEIDRVLAAADAQMRDVILVALLTGIDRGPLVNLVVRDFDPAEATLSVRDTKTASRPRTLPLPASAVAVLRRLTTDRAADESVFGLTGNQVEYRWDILRSQVGLTHVRFKDFRACFGTYWQGSLKALMHAMGHGNARTTMRYIRTQLAAERSQMEAVAERMGLDRAHLKLEGGE